MLDRPTVIEADATTTCLPIAAARERALSDRAMAMVVEWVETYLMRSHPDLGRSGAVCPFTKQAAKLDTIRLMIAPAGPGEEDETFDLMRAAFDELERIPSKEGMEHFRTVIIGFPNCEGPDGSAMLQRVQRRHRFYSLTRFRMIGFMHADSQSPGLWNSEFRPLRSPIPTLVVRHLVEQDAPFAAHNPLLMVSYLMRFRFAGARRLLANWFAG